MPDHNAMQRLVVVDSLRGFALAGVALVHMTEQYIAGPGPENFMQGVNGPVDHLVQGLIQFLIVGKFFALFSILFGLSFSLQMESAARRGRDFSLRFLWRALLLLAIGYGHHLFYRGDILVIYAMLAPFLIPFHKLSSRWIVGIAAIIFLGIPRYISFAILGNESLFGLPQGLGGPDEAAYLAAIQGGSLAAVFESNAVYGLLTKLNWQLTDSGRFYYTGAYFLLGLWIGRSGLLHDPGRHAARIKKALKWSALALVVLFGLVALTFSTAPQPVDFSHWQHSVGMNFLDLFSVFMTAVIGCGFVLLFQKDRWKKRLMFFAPYGRMALTNYILQSVVGTFLLFGWGLGMLGQVRTSLLLVIGIGLVIVQSLGSRLWLQRFQYGPLEWLWRCGTHLKAQPLMRRASMDV